MKKTGALLIMLISLISLFSQIYMASAIDPVKTAVDSKINEVKDTTAAKEAYLQNSWTNLLNKTRTGSVFIALNPVFKITIGMQFELSLLFLFSFLAWISLVVLIYFAAKDGFQSNPFVSLGIALIIPSLGSLFGAIPKSVSFFLPLVRNPWIAVASVGIVIIALVVYKRFMRKYGRKERRTEEEIKELKEKQTIAETARKVNELERKIAKDGYGRKTLPFD